VSNRRSLREGVFHAEARFLRRSQRSAQPLLSVEKKLIAGSLGLGLALLVVLVLIGRVAPLIS
jgi:hypothetical protein